MSDYGPDCGGRIKGVTIVKPIVFGNVARYFGKKREEDGHTHSWNVYVKPFQNEDMSTYVKKVHFKLHESYANPNRIITKPPFEVTETGWGEFEVAIKLYFMDPNERPITIYHMLKLFETDPVTKAINIKKYLCSEFYDEIIFQDPSAMMQQLLTNTRQLLIGPYKHETDFEDKKQKTISSIQLAKTKVRSEIEELKDRLKQTQNVIVKYKENISKSEAKQEFKQKQQALQQPSTTPTTTTSTTLTVHTPKSPIQSLKSPQPKQDSPRLQTPVVSQNIPGSVQPSVQPIEQQNPLQGTSTPQQVVTPPETEKQIQSETLVQAKDLPEPMDQEPSSLLPVPTETTKQEV